MAHSVVHSVYREAVTVSEWTVRINGVDRVNVKPGDKLPKGAVMIEMEDNETV